MPVLLKSDPPSPLRAPTGLLGNGFFRGVIMAKLKLTTSAVDVAQPQAQVIELRDTIVPGFMCKATLGGLTSETAGKTEGAAVPYCFREFPGVFIADGGEAIRIPRFTDACRSLSD